MRALFLPAITLMNRLTYTRKFVVLGLVSLVATTVVVYNLYVSLGQIIDSTQRELEGAALIKSIARTVQLVQQHRGRSAGVLGGVASMREERAAKEREAAEAIDYLAGQLSPELFASSDFNRIRFDWERLRKEGLGWSQEQNFTEHSNLIGRMLNFEVLVADTYALTLDPDIGSYYLIDTTVNKLPMATEHLGKIRAYGTGILSARQASTQQKIELGTLIGSLQGELQSLTSNLEKTGRYNPAMREALTATSNSIAQSIQEIIEHARSDILLEQYATAPEAFFILTTVAIDRIYDQVYLSLLPATETLLKQRADRARDVLLLSIGIAFLLFLVVIYFAIGGYYAVTGSIQSLANSARAFASGDMMQRVHLETSDELAWVGNSFNDMADSLAALLVAQQENQKRLHAIIDTALDAVVQMDGQGVITGWNQQAEEIFGWTREEVVGLQMHEVIIPPQYREAHVRGLKHYLATGEGPVLNKRIEIVGLHRNGHEFPIELAISPNRLAGSHEFSAFIRDITEKKQSEELIWNQANFDTLTHLPNRRMFGDRLEQEIKKSHRAHLRLALLFIDLDHFKEVNDSLGHNAGDQLLCEAARRISACVRESDTVARLGGDEFTVILAGIEDTSSVERVAESIIQSMLKPFQIEQEVAYVSASIGITLYPDDAVEVEGLLKNADQAMYVAKSAGRNRFRYFTNSMQEAAQKRLRLIHDLRGALADEQFVVYYQPIVELATGRIAKAEALLRWQHPTRGMIAPAEFIPLAEETGLIYAIGGWVFQQALRQLKYWRETYCADFQISVNKSPVQFQVAAGDGHWMEEMSKLGLPGESVVVEITEGLLLDTTRDAAGRLLKFRDAGIQVAIDDFGIGYSALSYLKKLDIDYLKIDQSFVHNLTRDSSGMALPEAIIVMAHKLGIKVVAEGVETTEQRGLLKAIGCDYAQGFLFAKPLPADQFEILLKRGLPKSKVTRLRPA